MASGTDRIDRTITLPREGYSVIERTYPDSGNHQYWAVKPDGTAGKPRYPGCSGIGQAFPDPGIGLKYWTEEETLRGVVALHKAMGFIPTDDHLALRGMLGQHELRWYQTLDAAAERGRTIHREVLEALCTGAEIPDLGDLPEEYQGYGQAVLKWWHDRDPQLLYSEQVVLSLDHGYAGRSDFIGILRRPIDPFHGQGVIDLKTTKGLRDKRKGTVTMPRAGHVQIKGYELAAIECGLMNHPADWLMLLQVCPDGSYREHIACATADDFLLALTAHKAAGALDKRMVPLP